MENVCSLLRRVEIRTWRQHRKRVQRRVSEVRRYNSVDFPGFYLSWLPFRVLKHFLFPILFPFLFLFFIYFVFLFFYFIFLTIFYIYYWLLDPFSLLFYFFLILFLFLSIYFILIFLFLSFFLMLFYYFYHQLFVFPKTKNKKTRAGYFSYNFG